jgi:hypothetical protein
LLQHLSDNGQVGFEVAANGLSNVTETLKDGRLELVTKVIALS